MRIEGFWYEGTVAKAQACVLDYSQDEICFISVADEKTKETNETNETNEIELWRCRYSDLKISEQLGDIPRRIQCQHHQQFVTKDNQAVNALIRRHGEKPRSGALHWLEKNWTNAIVALLISLLVMVGFAWKGVPFVASYAARHVPDKVVQQISSSSMRYFDRYLFAPSNISQSRQQQLRQYLSKYSEITPNIQFRKAGMANAFALPSGLIVFTDELIELAQHDEEILAIFLHEVGHVEHQHGLKLVIQSSIWSVMLALWLGDTNALAESLLTFPVLLTQSAFSREYETESDNYAYHKMQQHGIDLNRFADIMERLMQQNTLIQSEPLNTSERSQDDQTNTEASGYLHYLSTHPATHERIKKFRNGAKQPH